jgi:hypothetical protein
MQSNKLLRQLIREILVKEDDAIEYTPSDSSQDNIKIDQNGNPKVGSTSFNHTYAAGSSGGSSDWLYGNIKTVTDPLKAGGIDITKSIGKMAAQAISISWLLSNPWTAAMFGEGWLDKYLDTTEKGKTGEILSSTLKSALMKELNFAGIKLPYVAAIARTAKIPMIIAGISYFKQRMQNNPAEYPLWAKFFNSIEKIGNQLPNVPPTVKSLFELDKVDKDQTNALVHILIQKKIKGIKGNTPLDPEIDQLTQHAYNIIQQPGFQTPTELYKKITHFGINDLQAKNLVNLVFAAAGRNQPIVGTGNLKFNKRSPK